MATVTYMTKKIFANKNFAQLAILGLIMVMTCHVQYACAQKVVRTTTLVRLLESVRKISNNDTAIRLIRDGIRLSMDLKSDTNLCDAYLDIGTRYLNMNDYVQGISNYKLALVNCLNNEDTSNCYNHLGIAFFNIGDYVSASDNYYLALQVARRSNKAYTNLSSILANLGEVNFRLNQYDKALAYYNEGEPIARKQTSRLRLTNILLNKGELLTKMHRLEEARKILKEVIRLSDSMGAKELRDAACEITGISYLEGGAYKEAQIYLQQAREPGPFHNTAIEIAPEFYLADIWYALKKYDQAESVLLPALRDAAVGHRQINSLKGYKTLAAVYEATGRYKEALAATDSTITLEDSLESARKVNAINLMEFKFRSSEKDRIIAQNQLLIARQQGDLSRKNMWLLAIAGGIFLFILLGMGWYRTIQHERKLQAEQFKLIGQERKIEILNALVTGEDNERSRIARELHDGIGGMLSAAMMRFSTMRVDKENEAQLSAYSDTMKILSEMGEEIRKTAHNLMPEVLVKQDLAEAVRAYSSNVEKGNDLKIDFQAFGNFEQLPEKFKLNLYRIVQELLKNIVLHSSAHQVLVQLVKNEDTLTLIVEDDGKGFDTTKVRNGLGLHNIETRIGSMEGYFSLTSDPGKGTTVFIEFNMSGFNPDVVYENSNRR